MTPRAWLTTSWDDGHPLDLRIAEMLDRHGLTGTFYIPRSAKTGTMTAEQVRDLAGRFEVGGHTLEHICLRDVTADQAREQIAGSKRWIEDLTGHPCAMFCPPKGRFSDEHLAMVRDAGFDGARTVEFYSLDLPRLQDGLVIMPTTLHAYPHGMLRCLRNFVRRGNFRNLCLYLRLGHSTNWPAITERLLARVAEQGGVFHLWGHSWEIDRIGQWDQLEKTFALLAAARSRMTCLTNGELCRQATAKLVPSASAA